MKSQFKLAWFYFSLTVGVVFIALAVIVLPKEHKWRQQLVELTQALEWEAGIR